MLQRCSSHVGPAVTASGQTACRQAEQRSCSCRALRTTLIRDSSPCLKLSTASRSSVSWPASSGGAVRAISSISISSPSGSVPSCSGAVRTILRMRAQASSTVVTVPSVADSPEGAELIGDSAAGCPASGCGSAKEQPVRTSSSAVVDRARAMLDRGARSVGTTTFLFGSGNAVNASRAFHPTVTLRNHREVGPSSMAVATELMTHALIGRSSSPPFLDPIAEDHGLAHREHPQQVVGLYRVGDRAGDFTRSGRPGPVCRHRECRCRHAGPASGEGSDLVGVAGGAQSLHQDVAECGRGGE